MIMSKCYLGNTIFYIFSFTHKEEDVWPGGTHPRLFTTFKSWVHSQVLGL